MSRRRPWRTVVINGTVIIVLLLPRPLPTTAPRQQQQRRRRRRRRRRFLVRQRRRRRPTKDKGARRILLLHAFHGHGWKAIKYLGRRQGRLDGDRERLGKAKAAASADTAAAAAGGGGVTRRALGKEGGNPRAVVVRSKVIVLVPRGERLDATTVKVTIPFCIVLDVEKINRDLTLRSVTKQILPGGFAW
jgi:hypothetical protein